MRVTYPLAISPPLGSAASLGEERSTLNPLFSIPLACFKVFFGFSQRNPSFVIRYSSFFYTFAAAKGSVA